MQESRLPAYVGEGGNVNPVNSINAGSFRPTNFIKMGGQLIINGSKVCCGCCAALRAQTRTHCARQRRGKKPLLELVEPT